VLLKIAMEIQDKSKAVCEQPHPGSQAGLLVSHQLKMQKLRFKRFADLFKIALQESLPELDIWSVFFEKGLSKMVSPALRRDILCHSVPENSQLVNYLVILEANDNPYAVEERFEKAVIDRAFDQSRDKLLNSQP
jgi:hypothetical protein